MTQQKNKNTKISRLRSILRRLLYVLFCFAVFAVTMELCAQLEDWVRYDAPFFGTYDKECTYRMTRYGPVGIKYGRFEKWRMNNLGLRMQRDIAIEKPQGITRVLCLGASETFGLYEDEGMEWPAQLQRMLDEKSPGKYEVINGALPGFAFPFIKEYFEQRFLPLKPDVVLVYQSNRHYLYRAKDVFRPPGKEPLFSLAPLPDNWLFEDEYESRTFTPRLLRKGRELVKQVIPQWATHAYRNYAANREFARIEPNFLFDAPISEVPPDNPALLRQDLIEFSNLCLKHDIKLVLSTHAFRFTPETTIAFRRFVPTIAQDALSVFTAAYNDVVLDIAKRYNLSVAEVGEAFSGEDDVASMIVDHCHFSNDGAHKTAGLFAAFVSD